MTMLSVPGPGSRVTMFILPDGVFTVPCFVPKDCAILIRHMLKVDVTERATIADIKYVKYYFIG